MRLLRWCRHWVWWVGFFAYLPYFGWVIYLRRRHEEGESRWEAFKAGIETIPICARGHFRAGH